jgi:hypothetical protein
VKHANRATAIVLAVAIVSVVAATVAKGEQPATRAVATSQPSAAVASEPAVVRFELMPSGHIAIRARINGRGPYRFVFDTGAPALLVSERVGRLAGVLPANFRRPFFTLMGNLGDHVAHSIEVGGGRQNEIKVQVWNHPTVDLLARQEGPLEGLIGFPFFAHFRTTIDYRLRTITFAPSTYQPVDVAARLQAAMESDGPPVIAPAASLGVRLAKDQRDTAAGVIVVAVSPGGPGADAGLLIGDRLLTLDGRWTDAVDDVYRACADVDRSQAAMTATVSRDGRPMTLRVAVRPGI